VLRCAWTAEKRGITPPCRSPHLTAPPNFAALQNRRTSSFGLFPLQLRASAICVTGSLVYPSWQRCAWVRVWTRLVRYGQKRQVQVCRIWVDGW